MEYRVLGKTGLEISRLGFGGIPIQKIDAKGTKKLIYDLINEGVNILRIHNVKNHKTMKNITNILKV
jgi:predicted aldo/keto reductase-like oxidoreductase